MNLAKVETSPPSELSALDATQHLRDHLECALKLARAHDVPVVLYLIEMAILALAHGSTAPAAAQFDA